MNILQIIPSLSARTGGPAKAVLEFSRALAKGGHKVSVFATDHGGGIPGIDFEADGVKIELFKLEWPRQYFYSSALKEKLLNSIKDFDVVHIHGLWTYPTFIASLVARKHFIPYIIRPCGMLDRYCLSHHLIRKKIYRWLIEENNLRGAQAIHFTTEEEKERSEIHGLDSKATVIPLGLHIEEHSNPPPKGTFRNQHSNLKDKKIILFLGRINFKKGLDLLVKAFSQLVQTVPNVHLVIAGPDDQGYGKRLRRWILQMRIEQNITFTGFIEGEDKLALLCDSDIFCLPSHQENFGIAVLEAMAVGLPVVVSDQVNLHGEIESAGAGLVVRCDARELQSAVFQLLQDDSLRSAIGENGKRLVQERCQWMQVVKKYIGLYESLSPARSVYSYVS